MKYIIYLFTLAITLNACGNKKEAIKAKEAAAAQKAEEKKVMSSEERQAIIAEQMKNQQAPNVAAEYHKYVEQEMPSDAVGRIQRTNCFGRCPVYTLTVFGDGRLEYFGKKFTPREGRFIAKVDQKKIEALLNRAKEVDFAGLNDTYDNKNITDLPATITSIRAGEKLKTIVNRFDAPNELRAFEKYFDELFQDTKWEPYTGN